MGEYRFEVILNPLKRNMKALRELEAELKGVAPEKAFAGALMAMKKAEYIFDFTVQKK